MSATELGEKQKRFVEEYCIDLNAVQAAIRAGYSAKTATKQGNQLLGNTRIKAAIKEKQAKIAQKHDITREELIRGYRSIAEGDYSDYAEWSGDMVVWKDSKTLTKEQTSRIKEIRTGFSAKGQPYFTIVLHDKKSGLDGLAKLSGHIVERREHSGLGGNAIEHKHNNEIALDWQKLETEEVKQLKSLIAKAAPTQETK